MDLNDVSDKAAVIDELKEELSLAERTQAWAAKQLGISKPYISLVFTGHNEPSMELVVEMKLLSNKLKSQRFSEVI